MDDYLSKNAQPSRKFTGKDKSSSASAASASASAGHGSSGGDESSSDLISYRTRFRITALDHLNVVSLAQAKKRHELVDTVISHLLISVFHFWFLISSFLSFFLSFFLELWWPNSCLLNSCGRTWKHKSRSSTKDRIYSSMSIRF